MGGRGWTYLAGVNARRLIQADCQPLRSDNNLSCFPTTVCCLSTGQIICKDPKDTSSSKNSTFQDIRANNENSSNENTNMNILLNISLTPKAIRGQGPVTVQATTVSAQDLANLSNFPPTHTPDTGSSYAHWNGDVGDNESPLNLALNSVRTGSSSTSGSVSESHHTSRVSSTSSANYKHSASSSFAGVSAECSPSKQRRLNDLIQPPSSFSKASATYSGASLLSGVRRSPGQYEGSRRKLNPAFLTHIKPRPSLPSQDNSVGRRGMVVPLSTELEDAVPVAHSSSVDEDLVHVLNLKQEVD